VGFGKVFEYKNFIHIEYGLLWVEMIWTMVWQRVL